MRTTSAAALLAALVCAAAIAPAAAQAQPGAMRLEGTMLYINAEAKVSRAPDMAMINVGVRAEGATAAAALAENARQMNALMAALRRVGVAERDIQTSQLSVNPQYAYEDRKAPRVTGYEAQNMVTAKIRKLADLGKVVDAAVGAGGNQVHGVEFSVSEPEAALNEARREALQEARERAELYAKAAGMRVERIVAIAEGGAAPPPRPMPMMAVRAQMAESTPVSPGEVDLGATVAVTFELR